MINWDPMQIQLLAAAQIATQREATRLSEKSAGFVDSGTDGVHACNLWVPIPTLHKEIIWAEIGRFETIRF